MRVITLFLLAGFLAFAESSKIPQNALRVNEDLNKIVGGWPVDIRSYPYQVSLQYFYRHRCGGAIISNRWVLSAAHCTRLFSVAVEPPVLAFTVRLGTSLVMAEGLVVGVSRIVEHWDYAQLTRFDSDVTLIQLASELIYTPSIQPIPLPPANQQELPGASCVITGWGTLESGGSSPSTLHAVVVPWVSQESCNEYYFPTNITNTMMCAGFSNGERDACQGDSGGPLVVNGVLMGIVSWGNQCAMPNFPGVYAYVPAVRGWITEITGL